MRERERNECILIDWGCLCLMALNLERELKNERLVYNLWIGRVSCRCRILVEKHPADVY